MKNSFLRQVGLLLAASAVMFGGCTKDGDGPDTGVGSGREVAATVENGSRYGFDAVKAVTYYDMYASVVQA
ncbi:MAG: hypothetical protein LBE91_21780, partial [Tannerella sp.]|nr:hypothetical protein [Tannerella sp.]